MNNRRSLFILFLVQFLFMQLHGQQVVDTGFHVPEFIPAFQKTESPVVLTDLHHHNFAVEDGNYKPFFSLLEKDGYTVNYLRQNFSEKLLKQGQVLVIINALSKKNIDRWWLPVFPAFKQREISAVYNWVMKGGSLLLVADHMPFPAAAAGMAKMFGIDFSNGFAIDTISWNPLVFKRSGNTLKDHPVMQGRNETERIDSIVSFWGQAFTSSKKGMNGLFSFDKTNVVSYNPDTAWRFQYNTPVIPVEGWLQGAAGVFGKGRVIILGEAGMLTAQRVGPKLDPVGMNTANAKQNPQFILNFMHWLSFLLPAE